MFVSYLDWNHIAYKIVLSVIWDITPIVNLEDNNSNKDIICFVLIIQNPRISKCLIKGFDWQKQCEIMYRITAIFTNPALAKFWPDLCCLTYTWEFSLVSP